MKKMLLFSTVFLLSVLFIIPFQAKSETKVQGKLLDYGIIKHSKQKKRYEIPGEPGRYAINYAKGQIVETTDRIPMKKGTGFGIFWTITGLKDDTIELIYSVDHPEMILEDGRKVNSVTEKMKRKVKNGKIMTMDGYIFNHDYELVPGKWKYSVKYRDIEISKTFEVYEK